ncbi:hypothetical protein TNCV_2359271 [Trichonephila clavipes]|nr:hypothetical protein TNCV_2359271 [Trichonephila clavipes]
MWELEEEGTGLKKDPGERHTHIASNRRPLVRSSPGSWTEPNTRTKKCIKETLGFKRSWQSGSGGPQRKSATTCDKEEVQRWNRDQPVRRGHNTEDQFDPEEAGRNNSADPTLRSEEGQAAGVPEAEVVNNSIAKALRKGGANTNRVLPLEVLVGDVNYKT